LLPRRQQKPEMKQTPDLQHLTLNTGHLRSSPRSEVGVAALTALRPLVRAGGGLLPGLADFRVEIAHYDKAGAALWTVSRGPEPLATSACGWVGGPASAVWAQLEASYLKLTDTAVGRDVGAAFAPEPSLPWLATLLWPSIVVYPASAPWLADFNRCLAWTLITHGN
jgi:hypothetical protein